MYRLDKIYISCILYDSRVVLNRTCVSSLLIELVSNQQHGLRAAFKGIKMSNRPVNRGGNRAVADRDAIASRRGEQSGNRDSCREETEVVQVTDPAMVEMFCKDIANGIPGRYPIFSLKLSVEMRAGKEEAFPALYFHGTYGDHPITSVVRPGFFVGVGSLFRNPNKVEWKSAEEQALSLTILSKPEFAAALATVRVEQAEKRKAEEEDRATKARVYLESLQTAFQQNSKPLVEASTQPTVVTKQAKPTPPVLKNLADVMTARWGTFQHVSGVVLLVCFGMQFPGKPTPIVVRVKSAPAGHELEPMVMGKIFFFQNLLKHGPKPLTEGEVLAPKVARARSLCEWVMTELRAAGAPLPSKVEAVEGIGSMDSVNAEHATELDGEATVTPVTAAPAAITLVAMPAAELNAALGGEFDFDTTTGKSHPKKRSGRRVSKLTADATA